MLFVNFGVVKVAELYKILVLNSYHKGYPWTDDVINGVVVTFKDQGINTRFFIEYLDTKRYSTDVIFPDMERFFEVKYETTHFDVIALTIMR